MSKTRFEIVAFPRGERRVVAIIWRDSTEDVVRHAKRQAKEREEFVDIECDGDRVAVVGEMGRVA